MNKKQHFTYGDQNFAVTLTASAYITNELFKQNVHLENLKKNQDICHYIAHKNLQLRRHALDFNMSFTCRKVEDNDFVDRSTVYMHYTKTYLSQRIP